MCQRDVLFWLVTWHDTGANEKKVVWSIFLSLVAGRIDKFLRRRYSRKTERVLTAHSLTCFPQQHEFHRLWCKAQTFLWLTLTGHIYTVADICISNDKGHPWLKSSHHGGVTTASQWTLLRRVSNHKHPRWTRSSEPPNEMPRPQSSLREKMKSNLPLCWNLFIGNRKNRMKTRF